MKFYTVTEVATMLCLSKKTVRSYIRKGILVARDVSENNEGGQFSRPSYRISHEEIERFISSRKVNTAR